MKLLLWSQYFWPETFRINELAESLVRHGLSVTVLTGKPNYPDGEVLPGYKAFGIQCQEVSGIEIMRIPMLPRGQGSPFRLAINYLSFIASGYLFAPFALRGRPFDAVLVYAPSPLLQALPAILLSRLKHAPLVVWVQDLWPESLSATGNVKSGWILKTVEALVRHIYRCADSILIQSEAFRAPVARLTGDPGKIRYYPNSADVLGEEAAQNEHGYPLAQELRNWFSIVFTGNIGKAQALETIIRAADRLRDQGRIRFFIVGSGSQAAWMAEEIQRRKLSNVCLTGRLPSAEMPKIYAAASALLVTLRKDTVGTYTIPSKLQSYLGAGRPIIACMDGEGARVVGEARAGVTCPAEDVSALTDAVMRLLSMSDDERGRLGQNGYEYFMKHYELTSLTRDLIAHLDECRLKQRGSGK